MSDIFKSRNQQHYNLQQTSQFLLMVYLAFHRTGSLTYIGPKLWGMVLEAFRNIDSISQFKINLEMESIEVSV